MAAACTGLRIGVAGPRRARSMALPLINAGLVMAGALPLRMHPDTGNRAEQLDGLILSGGVHVHPIHYGQSTQVVARYDHFRDVYELSLLRRALQLGLPVLGICRGAQLLNVAQGGSLCQNITPLRRQTRPRHLILPLQPIRVVQPSRLAQILGRQRLGINRLHSQSIQGLGRGLRVVAVDPDGFVQAVESVGDQWLLGVQWHPEYLLYHPAHRRLFRALVRAAAQRRATRASGLA